MPPKTPRKPERPILWIVAGPNGSGKSSLYNQTDIENWGGSVWIINPDLLTSSIQENEGSDIRSANLEAVRRIEHWLYASINVYQTIGVETVLSSDKYRKLVLQAKARRFDVRMIYVLLKSVEQQIERVRIRVAEGGHDVPENKIRSRRAKSFEQLTWFSENVDELFIFENSTNAPKLIGSKDKSAPLIWHPPISPSLATELKSVGLRI